MGKEKEIRENEAGKQVRSDIDEAKNGQHQLTETWAADAQDELEDWIEEQGIQLRY